MDAPGNTLVAVGYRPLPERTAGEQILMILTCGLGMGLARPLPTLGLAIGAAVATYGFSILVNYRGMRSRFLKPLGLERRPNRATPWVTGIWYAVIGSIAAGIAINHI
jgi:hypothetical protein